MLAVLVTLAYILGINVWARPLSKVSDVEPTSTAKQVR